MMNSRNLFIAFGVEDVYYLAPKIGIDEDGLFAEELKLNQSVENLIPKIEIQLKKTIKGKLEALKRLSEKRFSVYRTLHPFSARKLYYNERVKPGEMLEVELRSFLGIKPHISLNPADVDWIKHKGLEDYCNSFWRIFYPQLKVSKVKESCLYR